LWITWKRAQKVARQRLRNTPVVKFDSGRPVPDLGG
jgi:hypothetical protein